MRRKPLQELVHSPISQSKFVAMLGAILTGLAGVSSEGHAVERNGRSLDKLITETIASRDRDRVWIDETNNGVAPVTTQTGDKNAGQPVGIRSGNYFIYPSVGSAVVYDDNIFASDAYKRGDIRTEITPEIQFRSNLPRHVLDFSLDGKIVNYADHSDQDYANYRARADAALHFDHAHTISLSIGSLLAHEERSDPLFPLAAAEPIPQFEHSAAVGITRDVGRLYGTLAAGFERRDYRDVESVMGSRLDQDGRDTDTWTGQFRAGYRFSPGFDLIGTVRASRIENKGNALGDLDAWGYEALAGLAFESNPLLKWRILGGYGIRDYDDNALDDLTSSLLQADVQWLPTQKLTIYGALYREIEDAFTTTGNGLLKHGAKLGANYEIYHNLILSGAFEYREDDFIGSPRTDEVYVARIGLDYYLTKNWLFTFGYEYQHRDSSDDLLDMNRNQFMVGAKLRF